MYDRKACSKRYYEKNKGKILERTREYRRKYYYSKIGKEIPETPFVRRKMLKLSFEEKKKYAAEKVRKYRAENKEKVLEYRKKYYHEKSKYDINFKIKDSLKSRLRGLVKKKGKTMDLVGCSIEDLMKHLESKFQEGMTWDNYGLYGWHIDHIRPCASFNLLNEEEQKQCFHYTNLQPLWAFDNLSKGSKSLTYT